MTDSDLLSALIAKHGIEKMSIFAGIEADKYQLLSTTDSGMTTGHVDRYMYWKGIKDHLENKINKK